MSAPVISTDTNFEQFVLRAEKPVLVEFWATWCAPCKSMSKVVDQFGEDFKSHLCVAKIDIDRNRQIASAYNIQSVPTTLLFLNGKECKRLVGAVNKQALATFVLDELY